MRLTPDTCFFLPKFLLFFRDIWDFSDKLYFVELIFAINTLKRENKFAKKISTLKVVFNSKLTYSFFKNKKQLLLIRYRYTTLKLLQSCMNTRQGGEDASELDDIKTRLAEYQQCTSLLKTKCFSSQWVCNSTRHLLRVNWNLDSVLDFLGKMLLIFFDFFCHTVWNFNVFKLFYILSHYFFVFLTECLNLVTLSFFINFYFFL